jgi:hypothetical protein
MHTALDSPSPSPSDILRAMAGLTPQGSIIERALCYLEPGKYLFIDTGGGIHLEKTEFLSGEKNILFSVKGEADGSYVLFPSLPPRNNTHVGNGGETEFHAKDSLKHSVVLNSGEIVSLANSVIFKIPSSLSPLSDSELSPELQIENRLAKAEVGARYFIGRKFYELPENVSRLHVTIEILSKNELTEGNFDLKVRVWPGQPSKQQISFSSTGVEEHTLTGSKTLNPGAKLNCGETIGTITLPYNSGSTFELSKDTYERVKSAADEESKSFLATMIKPSAEGEFTLQHIDKARSYTSRAEAEKALKIVMLEHFIRDGLELIKVGKHKESINHFSTVAPLAALGYQLEQNNVIPLSELTDKAARDNLFMVASRSWFKISEKMVYPSLGMLRNGLEPKNDEERKVLRRWQRELGLIYAEEWTHGLQDAAGGLVSKKAALIHYLPNNFEADVALYFQELGMPLSYHYVVERYASRQLAFSLTKGLQTDAEQKQLQALFESLPINGIMTITAGEFAAEGHPVMKLGMAPRSEKEKFEGDILGMRLHVVRSLKEGALLISKNPTGEIMLKPEGKARLYLPDSNGYYEPVDTSAHIEPGTPFYLGKFLRFVLN